MTKDGLRLSKRTMIGATLAALASCLTLLLASSPPSSAAGGGCPNANAQVGSLSKGQLRDSFICLFNSARSAGNLSENASLTDAAQKHASTMRSEDCFAHQCPGEPSLKKRIKNSGYVMSNDVTFGEIIAFAPDGVSTDDIVDEWLNSSQHRAQIKKSSYEDVGVGISLKSGNLVVSAVFGQN